MKETSIPYCPIIPERWSTIPNRFLFEYHSSKVGEKWQNFQLLSLTTAGVKEKDINASGGKVPESYDKYQTVEPGDMVFCLFDLDVSAVFSGLSHNNGMITSAYDVVRPNSKLLNQGFSDYWFQYVFSNRYYKMYSKNIRYTITSEMFKAIHTPIPPMKEQVIISEFLNKKCGEIDSLIDVENKQIEKLKEYKQAVITEAVTKGLDKSAPMKDSGVEWIGEIPEGWKVIKAKFIAENFEKGSGITKEDIVVDGDSPCVRYGEIYTKYNNGFSHCVTRTNLANVSVPVYFEYGDILFTCTGELVEEIGKNVVYLGKDKCLAGGDIIIMKHKQEPRFLNYAMNCTRSQMQKSYGKAKLKVVHISAYNIGSVYIALPSISIQKEIADYIDEKIDSIDSLITIKQKKIDKLNEYKKSLIYEYVTGKKEVIA